MKTLKINKTLLNKISKYCEELNKKGKIKKLLNMNNK